MNLRDLQYLVAVFEHQHFGKAAAACFVSQPTLSTQIKKLEETLHVVLIERTNKSVLFTPIGTEIALKAQAILLEIDALHRMAEEARNPFAGILHFGIIPTLAPYVLPLIVPSLSAQFPHLTLCLEEAKTAELLQKLKQGKLDALMLALPCPDDGLKIEPLFQEPFLLATPLNHPLSTRKNITLADLKDEALLLLDEGHCFREQALEVCHRARAVASTQFHATGLETLRYMVASHAGITLMPALSCRENDGVSYHRIHGTTPARRIGMVWRITNPKEKVLSRIAEEIRLQSGDGQNTLPFADMLPYLRDRVK